MTNFCKYCGSQINETQNFCKNCGNQIIRKNTSKENILEEQIHKIANQIISLQQGNTEEFNNLYDSTKKYVYYCIIKCGVPYSAVEDVMQETYLSIYNNIKKLNNPVAGLGWIKQIAFHKAMDYIRKNHRELLINEDTSYVFECPEDEIDSFPLPEDIIENRETQLLIMEILEILPADQKKIIIAYYYNECKVEQIAEFMGMPVGTIKTKLYRGRAKLKTAIKELENNKGIKLYTMPIAPILYALFHSQAEVTKVPDTFKNSVADAIYKTLSIENTSMRPPIYNQTAQQTKLYINQNNNNNNVKNATRQTANHIGKLSIKKAVAALIVTASLTGSSIALYRLYFLSSPEKTIEKFEDAYNNVNINNMVSCLDDESQKNYANIEKLANFMGITPQNLVDGIINLGKTFTNEDIPEINIEVKDVKYENRSYAKADCIIHDGISNINVVIELVKEDNEWHIIFNSFY